MNAVIQHKLRVTAVALAIIGTPLLASRLAGVPIMPGVIGIAHAQDAGGGHDSGGGSSGSGGHDSGRTGGHDSGGGSSGHGGGGGGHGGGGSGGGHEGGGETGGTVEKGHGTRYGHQGHESGQHQGAISHPTPGPDRFGGGSGVRGNSQVPEGVGRYGSGAASMQDVGRTRLRYWGGWSNPSDPSTPPDSGTETTDPGTGTTTSDFIPGPGGGPAVNVRGSLDSSPRCQGVGPGMPAAQQFSGGNLLRLNEARGEVDPALAASGKIAAPYLMGNLQNELIKPTPNPELAGTLLGLVAKTPVTPAAVKRIGFLLCARMSDTQADQIAKVAEQQRAALAAAPTPGK
ncbi:hypothetical protein PATSB16_12770 [Pandoraea thiooxydans]|uniref:Uncharacterized protein n=1 Tax=Pandoraea thiooxydans TaxID=445709 RepID=A0A0U4EF74_9BURK|nr:hypothetical protein [Pandoraea thiooxydans]ALX34865.1 hypothetical protein ABW99_20870 [Pandoraea thiooxydans]APR94619.1 hypothetical protein PATSB16_12770 [Pandoraea thiooxydans]